MVWNNARGADGFPGARFKDYQVKVYNAAGTVLRRTEYVQTESYVYTFEKNLKDGSGSAGNQFQIAVLARDIQSAGGSPCQVTFTNALPGMASITPTVTSSPTGFTVDWSTYNPTDKDLDGFDIKVDSVTPPVTLALKADAASRKIFIPVNTVITPVTYYVSVTPRDKFVGGRAGVSSVVVTATVTTSIDNSKQQWSDVSGTGKPQDNATSGAPAGTSVAGLDSNLVARQGNGVFSETFEVPVDPYWTSYWEGTVDYPLDGHAGGKVFRAASRRWAICNTKIPFDPAKLYRFKIRWRKTAGTTQTFLLYGIQGVAADGVTLVNATGQNDISGQQYFAPGTYDVVGTTWIEVTLYFKGNSPGNFAGTGSVANPFQLTAGTRYFQPLFVANWTGVGTCFDSVTEIDYISIDIMPTTSDLIIAGPMLPTYAPSQAGLYLTGPYMGFFDGNAWATYIGSDGKFYFKGNGNNFIQWDGSTLAVRGSFVADDIRTGVFNGDLISAGTLKADRLIVNSISSPQPRPERCHQGRDCLRFS